MHNDENRARKNVLVTLVCQLLYVFLSFICRTVFTYVLGAEYLGLNGLFTNILCVLSFVELGIGNAIVFKLYKPLHYEDKEQLCTYLYFYKKVYRVVMGSIIVVGGIITPFIRFFADAGEIGCEIYVFYLLFVIDTVISYTFVYKKSLLIADQKNYVVEIYVLISNILINFLQIIILYYTHSFSLYLIAKIVLVLLSNYLISLRVDYEYPYLREFNSKHGNLSDEEKKEFWSNFKGLLMEKIASVSFSGTDNIFMSIYAGLTTVGVVSQYTLILGTVNSLLTKVYSSLIATIGHMKVDSDTNVVEEAFRRIYFINACVYGLVCSGMCLLLNYFVTEVWLDKEYFLSTLPVVLLVVEVCIRGIHYPVFMARSAYGIFDKLRSIFVFCAFLNIALDVMLGVRLGIVGIFIATIVSRGIAYCTDIYVLYKYGFGLPVADFGNYVVRLYFKIALIVLISSRILSLWAEVPVNAIVWFVVSMIGIVIIYLALFSLFFWKTPEYVYYLKLINGDGLNRR